ncbi:MAG: hypothetical protein LBQ32_00840 [Burkholderiaceae bacterium]|nr:hypothetical protein [Burkholderiaceae bacterium]
MPAVAGSVQDLKKLKDLTTIIYALYAVGLVTCITSIAAIIMNYIKQDDAAGTLYESHFRWQVRTFWFGALWAAIGFALIFVLIGYVVLLVNLIWVIYRIVKGLLNLYDDKPMYA